MTLPEHRLRNPPSIKRERAAAITAARQAARAARLARYAVDGPPSCYRVLFPDEAAYEPVTMTTPTTTPAHPLLQAAGPPPAAAAHEAARRVGRRLFDRQAPAQPELDEPAGGRAPGRRATPPASPAGPGQP